MKTVLVVDDEPALRAVVRAVLGDEGYAVLEAPHGPAMLELLAREHADLVLLDVMMSDMVPRCEIWSGPEARQTPQRGCRPPSGPRCGSRGGAAQDRAGCLPRRHPNTRDHARTKPCLENPVADTG